jgi:hypothetical protein
MIGVWAIYQPMRQSLTLLSMGVGWLNTVQRVARTLGLPPSAATAQQVGAQGGAGTHCSLSGGIGRGAIGMRWG